MNVLAFQDNSNQVELLVKGKVTGSDNKPVEGASITVKGSKGKGVSSNNNGEFTISVRKGDILQVTSIGFDPKEISIVNGDDLGITLNPMDKAMSEVIVTALGIKKEKRKVAYAAQEVKGAELEKAREANVLSNLTGKVAGLSIQTKSTLLKILTLAFVAEAQSL
jgi:hypothetical protein